MKECITIISLIFLVVGILVIFFKEDIFKKRISSKLLTRTSGFVVASAMLLVIYLINR